MSPLEAPPAALAVTEGALEHKPGVAVVVVARVEEVLSASSPEAVAAVRPVGGSSVPALDPPPLPPLPPVSGSLRLRPLAAVPSVAAVAAVASRASLLLPPVLPALPPPVRVSLPLATSTMSFLAAAVVAWCRRLPRR